MNQQNREFQAYIGHLIDLYQLASFKFRVPHSYTKFRAIKSAKEKFQAQNFIETGTYLGVTTKRCAPLFNKVFTIELDPLLAKKAQDFLKRNKNVEVIQGDAVEKLSSVLSSGIDDILVFLDGHFSGRDTACGDLAEPAIEELKVLSKANDKIAAIIIDDFRLFGEEAGFPKKSELFTAIEHLFPEFDVTVSLDQVLIYRRVLV